MWPVAFSIYLFQAVSGTSRSRINETSTFYNSDSAKHQRRYRFQSLTFDTCVLQRQIYERWHVERHNSLILATLQPFIIQVISDAFKNNDGTLRGKCCSVSLQCRLLRKMKTLIDLIIFSVYWNTGGLRLVEECGHRIWHLVNRLRHCLNSVTQWVDSWVAFE